VEAKHNTRKEMRGGEVVKTKAAILLAMLMLMLAVAAPAFARGPETRGCIESFKSQGLSTSEAAQTCNRGRF
jgi:hypothetical protein